MQECEQIKVLPKGSRWMVIYQGGSASVLFESFAEAEVFATVHCRSVRPCRVMFYDERGDVRNVMVFDRDPDPDEQSRPIEVA